MRSTRFAPWAVLAAAVVAAAAVLLTPHLGARAPASQPSAATAGSDLGGRPAPDFRLTDQFGRPRRLSDFRGRVVVLPFIDSRCTTICPLTALVLQRVQDELGARAGEVRIVAVNANPLYTSVRDVREWSDQHGMTGRWLFLTGTAARLQPVWRAYGITAQMVDGIDMHTAAIYVIDRRGRERRLLLEGQGESIAREARDLMAAVRPLL
jgi:cytochrome oxidase Cu insertion factor (SCO1/SenC/PrrC family)